MQLGTYLNFVVLPAILVWEGLLLIILTVVSDSGEFTWCNAIWAYILWTSAGSIVSYVKKR